MTRARTRSRSASDDEDAAPRLLKLIERSAGMAMPPTRREVALQILRRAEKLVLLQMLSSLAADAAQIAIKHAKGGPRGE